MQEEKCAHTCEMVNVDYGFVITEKCYNCDKISTYFSLESRPPLEEYREGDHFWNVMESAQSFRFDLKCTKCGKVEKFDNLMGLMMCTG
ncbi:MAG: hypothetical protein KAS65_05195, partial [Candidatus Aminicenantes bacterium]|nr:hypothetical protein [Candidatus Aminicenantes bacterium]